MDQKRFVLFIVLTFGILVGWNLYLAPMLGLVPQQGQKAAAKKDGDQPGDAKPGDEAPAGKGAEVGAAADEKSPEVAAEGDKPADAAAPEPEAEKKPADEQAPKFPLQSVQLGSLDFDSGYRQFVSLTSQGAAVEHIELNDPRYSALHKPFPPLRVVGNDVIVPLTLEATVPQLEANTARQNWEVVDVQPAEAPHSSVTFRLKSEGLEITRRYELAKADPEPAGYLLKMEMTFRNLTSESRVVNYTLQGPTGIPLENVDNTVKYRDVVVGFVAGEGAVSNELLKGTTIAEGKGEKWQKAFDYIGVDVQYFAALLLPVDDQRKTPYFKEMEPQLVGPNAKEKSDVSVLLTSNNLELAAAKDKDGKDAVTHSFRLFAGPKRDDILPEGTSRVIDYGYFHMISRPMLALLKAFHSIFGSWGIAIICLTVVVRGALFPLSIKQARGAAKMQELQPEIQALKEKHGKDKEKFAKAQMELFSKHNYNPFAGCLPIFLQLPIFMGLYQALNHAVDLRMAKFLWINNLAAPDALFQLGMTLPLLGWKEFNLLPFITVGLFLVQQKMFMPPPTNEEQALQQKMMNFMTVIMGVMFYKVPAGLCVYFIASSLWGLAERKLLPKAKPAAIPPSSGSGGGGGGDRRKPSGDGNGSGEKKPGLWTMLLQAADKEKQARRESSGKRK